MSKADNEFTGKVKAMINAEGEVIYTVTLDPEKFELTVTNTPTGLRSDEIAVGDKVKVSFPAPDALVFKGP